jgi:CMP-N-acetylneuraminic acid synthetase
MTPNTINAFIPLKGHSARVPGKNLRPFRGRPLFAVIVGTLAEAERIETVYIDTDSNEIAAVAEELPNVIVIRRRSDLIGDEVSVNLLIKAFLETHEDEHLLQTHATNPLLTPETIDAAVSAYLDEPGVTSLFSVTRHQARFYDRELRAINHNPNELLPTQQLDPLFMENSNFYLFSRDGFFEHDRRITDATSVFEVDPMEAVDIDDERDFAFAEALAGILAEGR